MVSRFLRWVSISSTIWLSCCGVAVAIARRSLVSRIVGELVGIGALFRQVGLRPGGQSGARVGLRQRPAASPSAGNDRQPSEHRQQREPGQQHSSYHFL